MKEIRIKITSASDVDRLKLIIENEYKWDKTEKIYMVEFISGELDGKRWAIAGDFPVSKIVDEAKKDTGELV